MNLILDHINGVNSDNSPENLRFLCPNCNSQEPTYGGGNKGRVKKSSGGYGIKRNNKKFDYALPAESKKVDVQGQEAKLTVIKKNRSTTFRRTDWKCFSSVVSDLLILKA